MYTHESMSSVGPEDANPTPLLVGIKKQCKMTGVMNELN